MFKDMHLDASHATNKLMFMGNNCKRWTWEEENLFASFYSKEVCFCSQKPLNDIVKAFKFQTVVAFACSLVQRKSSELKFDGDGEIGQRPLILAT